MSSNTPAETPHTEPHLDSWHQHARAEGVPQLEHAGKVNAKLLAAWIGGILIFVVLFVGSVAVYLNNRLARDRAEVMETLVRRDAFRGYREGVKTNFTQFSWVDRGEGTVRTPIDDAKRRVVRAYGARASDGS